MSSRNKRLLPRATLHSDSEHDWSDYSNNTVIFKGTVSWNLLNYSMSRWSVFFNSTMDRIFLITLLFLKGQCQEICSTIRCPVVQLTWLDFLTVRWIVLLQKYCSIVACGLKTVTGWPNLKYFIVKLFQFLHNLGGLLPAYHFYHQQFCLCSGRASAD